MLWFVGLAGLSVCVVGSPAFRTAPTRSVGRIGRYGAGRLVVVAGGLDPDETVALAAALQAGPGRAVLLLDTPRAEMANRLLVQAFDPKQLVAVGRFPDGLADLERRLRSKVAVHLPWRGDGPGTVRNHLAPHARRAVLCRAGRRALLLHAACLAGSLKAPLYLCPGPAGEAARILERLAEEGADEVYLAGLRVPKEISPRGTRTVFLEDEREVAAVYLRRCARRKPVQTLVVANPADAERGCPAISSLAPAVAVEHRAALVLTDEQGADLQAKVESIRSVRGVTGADTVFLLGDPRAIPRERRPNPQPGKDAEIEMEPLTPRGSDPFSYAVGRLYDEDPGVVAAVLARRCLLRSVAGRPRALVVSNTTGSLPLVETLSRAAADNFCRCGYQTTTLAGRQTTADDFRAAMPEHDVVLWEGHYNPLVREYDVPSWDEPLRPALVFFQTCLALNDYLVPPLFQRGATGVIGASSRTYSATGAAFALAYFDAVLYERQSVGAALRHAKNFLLAYALLKQKRLGPAARWNGANLRSAWAFSLWGDPTLRLERPRVPEAAGPVVRHEVRGRAIILTIPGPGERVVAAGAYEAVMPGNGRLAGLADRPAGSGQARRLVPLVFAEVYLPRARAGRTPRLRSRVPSSRWVFCWDERRRIGYLLVEPRARDGGEIRMYVDYGK